MSDFYNYGNGGAQQQSGGGFYGGSGFDQQQQPGAGGYGGYGGNPQQWAAPQQSDPMQMQGGYAQPQQMQQQPNYGFNPALAAVAGSISGDTVMEMSKGFIQSGTAKMIPGLESAMLMLRCYFAVDNNYVKMKMFKVLFPFTSKHWKRIVSWSNHEACLIDRSSLFFFIADSKRIHPNRTMLCQTLTRMLQTCICHRCL